jgi:hypothetical protein
VACLTTPHRQGTWFHLDLVTCLSLNLLQVGALQARTQALKHGVDTYCLLQADRGIHCIHCK